MILVEMHGPRDYDGFCGCTRRVCMGWVVGWHSNPIPSIGSGILMDDAYDPKIFVE